MLCGVRYGIYFGAGVWWGVDVCGACSLQRGARCAVRGAVVAWWRWRRWQWCLCAVCLTCWRQSRLAFPVLRCAPKAIEESVFAIRAFFEWARAVRSFWKDRVRETQWNVSTGERLLLPLSDSKALWRVWGTSCGKAGAGGPMSSWNILMFWAEFWVTRNKCPGTSR